ncbi:hypothetical protein NECAME_10334 [Necator americanus]|uniref:Uncharacterized protein n=1 Tax=Necator americanus TaxID=51031 RepID=W2T925_NECAM|nr:hypothetical protein NECAME_10334 [Necator americanus]ETN78515.1 hypothetical protein NECAME_10334 [Necator americanus]
MPSACPTICVRSISPDMATKGPSIQPSEVSTSIDSEFSLTKCKGGLFFISCENWERSIQLTWKFEADFTFNAIFVSAMSTFDADPDFCRNTLLLWLKIHCRTR